MLYYTLQAQVSELLIKYIFMPFKRIFIFWPKWKRMTFPKEGLFVFCWGWIFWEEFWLCIDERNSFWVCKCESFSFSLWGFWIVFRRWRILYIRSHFAPLSITERCGASCIRSIFIIIWCLTIELLRRKKPFVFWEWKMFFPLRSI